MPALLLKVDDHLEVDLSGCRGMEFMDAKEKVRDIPGRRWDPESKNWILPGDPAVAERVLKTIRPEASDELRNWVVESRTSREESLTAPLPEDADDLLLSWAYKREPWQPERIGSEPVLGLLPEQRAAVKAIAERGRAILADDMGKGKTVQSIAAIEEFCLRNGQMDGPKLIVAPASVMGGWERELRRWLKDPSVVMIRGSMPAAKRAEAIAQGIEDNAWIIVNWEQLRIEKVKVKKNLRNGGTRTVTETRLKQPLFGTTEWLAVVADEAHRAKNRKAAQTQGLWRVQGKVMIAATGTPIMNSPDEIWSLLRWLWPNEYGTSLPRSKANPQGVPKVAYWTFFEDFVDYYEDHFNKKIVTGVKNPDALRFILKDKLIRRLWKGKGRKRISYPIELNPKQQKIYDEAETAMWLELKNEAEEGSAEAADILQRALSGDSTVWQLPNGAARLVRLQQIVENPALLGGPDDSAIMDDLEQKITDSRPEPWVVFFKYRQSCDLFAERLKSKHGLRVGVYHGDVPPSIRTDLEDSFQAGDIDVMVGTIGAMKEGITLTRSRLMAFATRDFVPDVNEQCEAREDRIGQNQLVLVYIPQATGTVAVSKVEPTNKLKEQIVRSVLQKQQIKEGSS